MLSCRDTLILKELEKFSALTIKQIGRLLFPRNEHNYYYTRKRLKQLEGMNVIKSYLNEYGVKRYYIPTENTKKAPTLSMHREKVIDFYTLLIYYGVKVIDFKFEYEWMDKRYYSDGIFVVEYNGTKNILVCEIDYTSATKISKYDDIYKSGQAQDKFGVFPFIFIVNSTGHNYKNQQYICKDYVYFLDFNLNDFQTKVIGKIIQ